MRRLFASGVAILVPLFMASSASGAVDQTHDSVHHEVDVVHDTNICGDSGTFTFDITNHTHALDNGTSLVFNFTETVKYTLVFDDPALGTWSAHGAETTLDVATPGGEVFHEIFNSREGPVQITEHLQFHTDADGDIRVDRTFERHVGC
jgi:hypothetical protein